MLVLYALGVIITMHSSSVLLVIFDKVLGFIDFI